MSRWNDFKDSMSTWWDTITGQAEQRTNEKAQALAEQSQQWNEQYSEKQLAQQEAQFAKSQDLGEENLAFQREIADKNFQMQQDVFSAQQRENELLRQREDTAYQRQLADLKAAGLSPLMASNGASASQTTVGNAPQYDSSGIGNAYGSYIQMAQEFAQLRNMAQGQYASRRQQSVNERIGAAMALSQMYSQRRAQFQNLAVNGFNLALNIAGLRKRNQLIDEQIKAARQLYNFNEDNGNRNLSWQNYLVSVLDNYMSPQDAAAKAKNLIELASTQGVEKAKQTLQSIQNIAPDVKKGIEQTLNDFVEKSQQTIQSTIDKNVKPVIQKVERFKDSTAMKITAKKSMQLKWALTHKGKNRENALNNFYSENSDWFKNKMYKWQFENLTNDQLRVFMNDPLGFIEDW